jgi:hypothetical protein
MRGSTPQVDNETDDDETDDGEDLDRSKPKLAFTEGPGTQKVDGQDDNTSYCNPHGIVGLAVPVCRRS